VSSRHWFYKKKTTACQHYVCFVHYPYVNNIVKTDVQDLARSAMFDFGEFFGHHYLGNQQKGSKMKTTSEM
jgi:hypothetical protein